MSDSNNQVFGKCTFKRGVHPPHRKMSEMDSISEIIIKPGQLFVLPMVQHIGAPCQPCVEKGQDVEAGQVVGQAEAFVSATVHSSVRGVVKEVVDMPHPSGRRVLSVVVTAGENQPGIPEWQTVEDQPVEPMDPHGIATKAREAGLVGQGGAAFPTHVKLARNPQKPIDTILLNGCECEPYLTSDHRLMLEAAQPIIKGLELAVHATGARKGIIAIEDNKPDAIEKIRRLITGKSKLQLAICKTKYPQGGEKQLISAVLKRAVPNGGLPLDVGVVVMNAGTAASLAFAVIESRPVYRRVVTVTGRGIKNTGNYLVPVGMLLEDLLKECGGLTRDAGKVLLGGPMMGPTTSRLDVPILKGTSGITVMSQEEFRVIQETACIRCSRCVDVCPMNLVPTRIAHAVKARDIEMALDWDLTACMECGCCTYVCPAQIPLLQYLRSGKVFARQLQNQKG